MNLQGWDLAGDRVVTRMAGSQGRPAGQATPGPASGRLQVAEGARKSGSERRGLVHGGPWGPLQGVCPPVWSGQTDARCGCPLGGKGLSQSKNSCTCVSERPICHSPVPTSGPSPGDTVPSREVTFGTKTASESPPPTQARETWRPHLTRTFDPGAHVGFSVPLSRLRLFSVCGAAWGQLSGSLGREGRHCHGECASGDQRCPCQRLLSLYPHTEARRPHWSPWMAHLPCAGGSLLTPL